VVRPGSLIQLQWKTWGKGLAPLGAVKLTASYQQSPALADDEASWKPLAMLEGKGGEQALELPKSLNEGLTWLRIGLTDDKGKPSRLLAELPLIVRPQADPPPAKPVKFRNINIGDPEKSRVPAPFQQETFLHRRAVSALDISDDGKSIAVASMAFRHDRNFWLLGRDGKIQWGRFVEPWAPFQTAILPGGRSGV